MNRLLLAATVALTTLFTATVANAQTTATGTGTATSSSNSGAVAISRGGGGGRAAVGNVNASVVFNTPGVTTSTIRTHQSGSVDTTPNAIAPGLGSAAVETCYGPGVSGGIAVTGFGASFGMGQYDQACNRRLNARTMYAMGGRYRNVAVRIMANEPEVQKAMADEGLIRLEPGDVAYRAPTSPAGFNYGERAPAGVRTTNYMAQGTASRAGMFSSCQKWSGGSTGVGSCLY